jgi:serine protease Do
MYYSGDQHSDQNEQPIEVNNFSVDGKPRKKHSGAAKIIALCLVCALIGGLAGGAGVAAFGDRLMSDTTTIYTGSRTPVVVDTVTADTHALLTLPQIYSTYVGSTVGITVDIVTTNIFGQTVTGAAAGSGFVITSDGYIATNYHVIEDANTITVAFVDGTTYRAVLVGGDSDSDIAVLKVDATGLIPVVLGDSDAMQVGDQVAAIGNPLGELTYTLTSGYVSALDRSVTMSDGTAMTMLQTDTAINSGNSGGPLFNMYGEVIGITSAKYSGTTSSNATIEGIGFAIPINSVTSLIKDIMENGYVTGKPFLGISVQTVDSGVQSYGIPAGAEVALVTPNLCADKAGLQVGDIITAVDDTTITSSSELIAAKNNYKAGDTAAFTIYRGGQTLTLNITFDEENTANVKLQTDYAGEQSQSQQSQQSQSQQGGSYSWPFGGGFR